MLILFAALQSIPHELYEAAAVDGANGIQIATKIRIPLIAPAVVLTGIFSIIGTLQLFNEPNVLNSVAPSILNPHFTPNLYVYSLAFRSQQFDYSATMAFTLAFVTGALASVFFIITRRGGGRQ
jgi:multiple sugar transport system permease protein